MHYQIYRILITSSYFGINAKLISISSIDIYKLCLEPISLHLKNSYSFNCFLTEKYLCCTLKTKEFFFCLFFFLSVLSCFPSQGLGCYTQRLWAWSKKQTLVPSSTSFSVQFQLYTLMDKK